MFFALNSEDTVERGFGPSALPVASSARMGMGSAFGGENGTADLRCSEGAKQAPQPQAPEPWTAPTSLEF